MDNQVEVGIQSLKVKLNECKNKDLTNNNKNGKINNLMEEEFNGLKSIKQKKKNGEVII